MVSEDACSASVLPVQSGENEEFGVVLDDASRGSVLPVLPDQNEKQAVMEWDDARNAIVLPGIPDLLTAMANLPFPHTEAFQKAFQSSQAFDESELLQYEHDPPYSTPPYPTDTPAEQNYTKKMTEAFLGRQLRMRKKFEESQMQRLSKDGLTEERWREFFVLLQKWMVLKRHMETYQAGMRELAMARTLLWWRAYLVVTLASEIQGDE
jgi:hypothetical protein